MSTSSAAYAAAIASGLIPRSRQIVYDDLYKHGPSTAREIYARTKLPQSILNRSRFNELERQGLVERDGKRNDGLTPTDTETTVWKWLPNYPKKLKRQPGPKKALAMLISAIEKARGLDELRRFVTSQFGDNLSLDFGDDG